MPIKPPLDTIFGGISLEPYAWELLRLHFFLPRRERQRWWQDRDTPRVLAIPQYYCETCNLSFTHKNYQPTQCSYCHASPGQRRIICYEPAGRTIVTFPFMVNAERLALVNWQCYTIAKES